MGFRAVVCIGLMLGTGFAHGANTKTSMYGYVNSYFEKVSDTPVVDSTTENKNPMEFDVPDIHFVMLSTFEENYKAFLNLAAPGASEVKVSNAWVEAALAGDFLNLRMGKTYRPFGLYNEILDAVPTYIGIEPPEMLDKDHLFLSRTTSFMLHGKFDLGHGYLNYALMTGNDEKKADAVPLGADLNYTMGSKIKVGASFYTTGGDAENKEGLRGGVLPWMEKDNYSVYGGYFQYTDSRWTFQTEYFTSSHDALRDVSGTNLLCDSYGGAGNGPALNTRQQARYGCAGGLVTNADGDYDVQTWYMRLGYNFLIGANSDITPYIQYDTYSNPETIQDKDFGGDGDEAGMADDGKFSKSTLGVVYRPVPPIAIKADYSGHYYTFNGSDDSYDEVRFSFSYYWRL